VGRRRCNSSDIKVNGAIRDQPACSMMARPPAAPRAVIANRPAGLRPRHGELVETLRATGAYLPQTELRKTMTRAA